MMQPKLLPHIEQEMLDAQTGLRRGRGTGELMAFVGYGSAPENFRLVSFIDQQTLGLWGS